MNDKKLSILGAAVSAILAQKPDASTPVPDDEIKQALGILTPELVQRIAANEMPDCFTPDRASYVAMAQLLNEALMTIERVLPAPTLAVPDNPKVQ
jgi:hypothetical protein